MHNLIVFGFVLEPSRDEHDSFVIINGTEPLICIEIMCRSANFRMDIVFFYDTVFATVLYVALLSTNSFCMKFYKGFVKPRHSS